MYVYSKLAGTVWEDGKRYQLSLDEVVDASAEIVRLRPDLFGDAPEMSLGVPIEAPVEAATAAPGAKRSTRRAAKK